MDVCKELTSGPQTVSARSRRLQSCNPSKGCKNRLIIIRHVPEANILARSPHVRETGGHDLSSPRKYDVIAKNALIAFWEWKQHTNKVSIINLNNNKDKIYNHRCVQRLAHWVTGVGCTEKILIQQTTGEVKSFNRSAARRQQWWMGRQ